ncbi:hypothetical protein C8R44DRAFT_739433 [Mycena epipterygia]|nr:hypothetical protein C8R44DRAFT_739433 [Mycena epipterygia]
MAITHNRSARSSSPTPSENSDMYYDDFDNASPSPTPSQTADPFGWESDGTPAPMDSRDATPTQVAHPSSPPSVVEISREEFPPLPAEMPATATKPSTAKATKAKKGKGKAKTTETAAPGSPSKRQHANTAGDTSPAPFTTVTNAVSKPAVTQPAIAPPVHAPVPAPATMPTAAAIASAHTPAIVPTMPAIVPVVAAAGAAAAAPRSPKPPPPSLCSPPPCPLRSLFG